MSERASADCIRDTHNGQGTHALQTESKSNGDPRLEPSGLVPGTTRHDIYDETPPLTAFHMLCQRRLLADHSSSGAFASCSRRQDESGMKTTASRRNSRWVPQTEHERLQLEQLADAPGRCKLAACKRRMQGDSNMIHRKCVVPFVPYRSERLASVVHPDLTTQNLLCCMKKVKLDKDGARRAGIDLSWELLLRAIMGAAMAAHGKPGTGVCGSTTPWLKGCSVGRCGRRRHELQDYQPWSSDGAVESFRSHFTAALIDG